MIDPPLRKRSLGASLLLHGTAIAAVTVALPRLLPAGGGAAASRSFEATLAQRHAPLPVEATPEEPPAEVVVPEVPVELPPPLPAPDDAPDPADDAAFAEPVRATDAERRPALADRDRILARVPRTVVLRPMPRPEVAPRMDDVALPPVAPPGAAPEETEEPEVRPGTPAATVPAALAAHCPRPVYPESWARRGWAGVVVIELDVGPDGAVLAARVVESSGYERLDELARTTLLGWRFAPATEAGEPVAGVHRQRLSFER